MLGCAGPLRNTVLGLADSRAGKINCLDVDIVISYITYSSAVR